VEDDGLAGIRLGVLGGTFNPIHFGHLHIARSCQRLFSLSQVHFVVAAAPPHKSAEELIPFAHRYAMVCLAASARCSFIPSLMELEPPASPFSVDTMSKFAHRADNKKPILYFIAGGDSLAEVKSWRESETLLTSYNFIFVQRPGTTILDPEGVLPKQALAHVRNLAGFGRAKMQRKIAEEENSGETRIYIVDLDAPDISATRIRIQAGKGKSIKPAVPGLVRDYIRKLNLYGVR
jgi:nicotinate-nucleotide adenylyltransferase